MAQAGCKKKDKPPGPLAEVMPQIVQPKEARVAPYWQAAQVIAGTRSGAVPGMASPEHSLWQANFEGQDARRAKLTLPYIAVQDQAGRVYIADKLAHSVRWIDEIQEIHTAAGTGQSNDGGDAPQAGIACALSFPNALWVHPSGRLYILDFGNAKLRRLGLDGKIETLFDLPKDLKGGRGLVVEPDESVIYVAAKDRIYRHEAKGAPKVFAQGFVNLGHLVLGPNGELYAADRDAGYVYRLDSSGEKSVVAGDGTMRIRSTPVAATKQGLNQPRALAWAPGLGLLIGTQGGRRVYRLDPSGALELLLDGKAPSSKAHSGEFSLRIKEPLGKLRGLFVAPNGDLLLTHGDLGQVIRFPRQKSAT